MVIEHEAGDLTCTVEAQTPMVELQSVLAGAGQMLALDPPGDELSSERQDHEVSRASPRQAPDFPSLQSRLSRALSATD